MAVVKSWLQVNSISSLTDFSSAQIVFCRLANVNTSVQFSEIEQAKQQSIGRLHYEVVNGTLVSNLL